MRRTRPRLIFKGEDVRVRSVIVRDDGPLIFTFTPRRYHRQHTVGYGERLFESRGINAVHFVSSHNHWWHTVEMLPAIAAAQDVHRALAPPHVLTYGYSMGGFGALVFANRLSANSVLAFSPQSSLFRDDGQPHPSASKIDFGPTRDMCRLTSDCLTGCKVVICYDPMHRRDVGHRSAIEALHPVTAIRMPFAGHRTPNYLKEVDGLSGTVLGLIDGSADWRTVRQSVRSTRHTSTVYFGRMLRQRPGLADSVAPRLERLILDRLAGGGRPPDQHTAEVWLERRTRQLSNDGQPAAALAHADAAAAAYPDNERIAFVRASLLAGMGNFVVADDILAPLVRSEPHDVRRRLLQATILTATGRAAEAETVLADCLAHGRDGSAGWRPAPAIVWRDAALAMIRHGLPEACRRSLLAHVAALLPQDREIARAARRSRLADVLRVLRKPTGLFGR